jgi:hypothetical protein
MFGVFVFAAVFGWLFVAIFLFSSTDFDGDVGLDADMDLDVDTDLDLDTDAGGHADTAASLLGAFFSFRSIVFFMAFFGLTGILLTWLDTGTFLAVVAAIGIGLFAAFINVKLMDYLRRTSVSSRLTDSTIAGNAAKVIVPISRASRGKVAVTVSGQPLYLVALPFNDRQEAEYAVGDTVVIVEVKDGAALVAAMDDLD